MLLVKTGFLDIVNENWAFNVANKNLAFGCCKWELSFLMLSVRTGLLNNLP